MAPTDGLAGHLILIAALLATAAIAGGRIRRLVRLVRSGAPEPRTDDLKGRIRDFGLYVLGQKRLIKSPNRWSGWMHALIFWGFLVIQLGAIQLIGGGLATGFLLPAVGDDPAFMALLDAAILAVLLGIGAAAYRRLVLKPYRLTTKPDAWIILGLIGALMLTLLLSEAFGAIARPSTLARWSFIGNALAGVLGGIGPSAAERLYGLCWWLHVLTIMGFAIYLPSSKHLHILTAAFTVFFRPSAHKGALEPIRAIEEREHFGVGKLEQFGWKQLLDTFSCTECGRCDRNCPALLSGKPLSPKELVLNLKYGLFEEADSLLAGTGSNADGQHPLIGGLIAEETLWSCTTCRWCVDACPVFIEHVPKILEMRRHLVLEESRFPAEVRPVFENLERNGNPWQISKKQRAAWAADLEVPLMADVAAAGGQIEVLYFVGCMGSFDQRNKKVAQAVVRLLKAAGVRFAILGKEETCTGDPARRIGNEYLYQTLGRAEHRHAERVRGENGADRLRPLLQHHPQRVSAVRRRLPGAAPHRVYRGAGRGGAAEARSPGRRGHHDLPRPLLPGPLQRRVRAAAPGAAGAADGQAGGDGALAQDQLLLRGRRGPLVHGRADRDPDQRAAGGAGAGGAAGHDRGRLPVLHHDVRGRDQGQGRRGQAAGARLRRGGGRRAGGRTGGGRTARTPAGRHGDKDGVGHHAMPFAQGCYDGEGHTLDTRAQIRRAQATWRRSRSR